MRDFSDAELSLQQCLNIRRIHFKTDSMKVAAVLFMLGQLHLFNGDVPKGLPLFQEAAAMSERLQGKNDFSAIISLFMHAQVSEQFGNIKAARTQYEQMETKGVRLLGEKHQIVAYGRRMFGEFLIRNGEMDAGVKLFHQAIGVYQQSYGPNSPIVARAFATLGTSQRDHKKFDEAEISFQEAVRIFRTLSVKHRDVSWHAICLHRLGAMIYNRGERTEAENLVHEGLHVLFENGLKESSRAQMMAHTLAMMLLASGNHEPPREFSSHLDSGEPENDLVRAENWSLVVQIEMERENQDESVLDFLQKRSVASLRSAIKNGLQDPDRVLSDSVFDPLRHRADFKGLKIQN